MRQAAHRNAILALALIVLCAGAAPAGATAQSARTAPRLLAAAPDDNSLSFEVRPTQLSFDPRRHALDFFLGAGMTARQWKRGKVHEIRWRRWRSTATARATDFYIQGSHVRRTSQVRVRAWRPRHGRYSRLSITHKPGQTHVFALRYRRVSGWGHERLHVWCRVKRRGCQTP